MIGRAKDFWSGLLYILFGLSAIVIARDYGMGAGSRWAPPIPQLYSAGC